MPRKVTHGDRTKSGRYMHAYYERNPMVFIITHDPGDDGFDVVTPLPESYSWTLHRKVKTEVGEAICRSVESWPTEKQCRAAINTAKKAMAGVRFAQTRVEETP